MEDFTTVEQLDQAAAVIELVRVLGPNVEKAVQAKLNVKYPNPNGAIGEDKLAKYVERLENVITAFGDGELPRPGLDSYGFDEVARQASDAAYTAAEQAMENIEIDDGELIDAENELQAAIHDAAELLDEIKREVETDAEANTASV